VYAARAMRRDVAAGVAVCRCRYCSVAAGIAVSCLAQELKVLVVPGAACACTSNLAPNLLQLLEANVDTVDGVMSVARHKALLFTGCFAMRAGLLLSALQSSEWNSVRP
jgi:hypothetical protein